jgi:hypothetical protein
MEITAPPFSVTVMPLVLGVEDAEPVVSAPVPGSEGVGVGVGVIVLVVEDAPRNPASQLNGLPVVSAVEVAIWPCVCTMM